MIGMFVTSKAGHDKNQRYIIYEETNEYVYLIDGISKTQKSPKRKNRKHIQLIKESVNKELIHKIENKLPIQNEEIRKAIQEVVNVESRCN